MAAFKHENVEDLYEIEEVLGSGHFGQVRVVRERSTGARWAGKFLKIRKCPSSRLGVERASVEAEVEVLQALQHHNISALKDVFTSRAQVVLVLELVSGGELFDFIAEKESLSEGEAVPFLTQILQGVSFMHSKNIGHFDLKPENIMLSDGSASPDIKIIDFGLAHRFSPGEEYRSQGGTPQYIPPEVINYEPLSTAVDMWSIGVITFILLSGLSPFQEERDEDTLRNVLEVRFSFPPQAFCCSSALAQTFITSLLTSNQSERMTADECLLHPWIKPITRKQAHSRNRSSINMKNFKKFNAKRKWKVSYNMVKACTRMRRLQLLCQKGGAAGEERQCESDQEDTETKPASLIRRRLSSSS